jgi:hypothetical protein
MPKVAVSFQYITTFGPHPNDETLVTDSDNDALSLSATNMGPIQVTLHNALTKNRDRKGGFGLLKPLPRFPNYRGEFQVASGPFGGGVLPKKIEVGEQFFVYFVPDYEALTSDDITHVGFSDTFGRFHWASKKDLIEARKHIREACDKAGKRYSS